MKKVLIVVICIVVLVLLILGGFFIYKNFTNDNIPIESSGEQVQPNMSLAERAVVSSLNIIENASGSNRIINVTYPSIQSFTNKNFQKSVNDEILKVITAYINEISTVIDDETPDEALYTYDVYYDKYACGDYLSLVIFNNYQTGGIRSNKWKDIYNINVRSERIFYLEDIFPANVDFETKILEEIKEQAKENNYVLMNGEGLLELSPKQKFYIKDEKLVIYFDPAEVAPATYGELQFEMPFTLGDDGLFR